MDLPINQRIIFFSPHPDDEVISAGGLITSLVRNGNKVSVYYLTNSPKGIEENIPTEDKIKIRQKEAINSCKILKVDGNFLNLDNPSLEINKDNVNSLKKIITRQRASIVITLHAQEAHSTHRKTTQLVNQAIKNQDISIWYGECWSPIQQPNDIFSFSEDLMKIKISALGEYKSQLKRTNWIEAVKGLNRYRAITAYEVLGSFGNSKGNDGLYGEAFVRTTSQGLIF